MIGPIAKFLEEEEYTMPSTTQQNGVVERRNRTLMDMVRSMLSKFYGVKPKNCCVCIK
jgi:hypothetical protein